MSGRFPTRRKGWFSTGNMYGGGGGGGGDFENSNANSNTGPIVIGVVGLLLDVALLILLVIHMVNLGSHSNQLDDIYTHTFCPEGNTCKNGGLVGGSGICSAQGECIGTPKGQCDSGLSPYAVGPDVDCRNLTFSWPVDVIGLFRFKLCWFGRCVYALEAGLQILDWSCTGQEHGHYELKELGAKRCRSFISEDPDAAFFDTTLTCISGEPICIYSIEAPAFNYPFFEGDTPPWVVGSSGSSGSSSNASATGPSALTAEPQVLIDLIADAYALHKQQ